MVLAWPPVCPSPPRLGASEGQGSRLTPVPESRLEQRRAGQLEEELKQSWGSPREMRAYFVWTPLVGDAVWHGDRKKTDNNAPRDAEKQRQLGLKNTTGQEGVTTGAPPLVLPHTAPQQTCHGE